MTALPTLDAPSSSPAGRQRALPADIRTVPDDLQEERSSSRDADMTATHPSEPKPSRWSGFVVLIVLAAVVGTGWYYRDALWPYVAKFVGAKTSNGAPKRGSPPVMTAKVRRQDMNLFLNGLGTVTPLKTVTVRSRVEGELVNVTFTEGQMVKEGQLLAEIDKRPFELQRDQAAGQLARDEATLASAQLTLDRYEQLLKEKIIPTQQVQEQRALVQQTEGAVKTDQAMIANAELQITYSSITAPVSGRIGLRLVDIGNIVRANDQNGIAVINQIRPITIVFTISQDDIPRIQKRMREGKDLRVDAYDREFTNKLATGKLLATDNQVDSTTGTLKLKAIFDEDADKLFPNQFVNTRLLVDERHNALTVPSAAIQRGPKGTFVYVVNADHKVDVRLVDAGPSEGQYTIVEKGLQMDEVVVTDGLDKLQPGAEVTVRDPNAQDDKSGHSGHKQEGSPEKSSHGNSLERGH